MKIQRFASLFTAIIEALLYSGILFGWGSLTPVLVEEGFFSDGCPVNKTENLGIESDEYRNQSSRLCDKQMTKLDLLFTIASTLSLFLSLFIGFIYDKLGGWFTRTYCLILLSVGLSLCAVSTSTSSNLLFLSFSLVAHAGTGLYTVNVQVANFFPKYRSFICALISGMYDSSSLVFLVFSVLYQHGIAYKTIFLFHAVMSIFFHVSTFILTPKYPPELPLPEGYVYGYRELGCGRTTENDEQSNPQPTGAAPERENLMSFKECLKLPYTWTNVLYTCTVQFCMANFIGNFSLWINSTFPNEDPRSIEQYTTWFGVVQCSGFIFSPLGGLLMDHLRARFTRTLPFKLASLKAAACNILISAVLTSLMLSLSLIPIFKLQILTFVMQAIARAFICGTLSAFLNIAYPACQFGKLYGINMTMLGAAYLLQYPLAVLVTEKMNGSFAILNFVLLALCLLATTHPLYIFYFVNKKSNLEQDKICLIEEDTCTE